VERANRGDERGGCGEVVRRKRSLPDGPHQRIPARAHADTLATGVINLGGAIARRPSCRVLTPLLLAEQLFIFRLALQSRGLSNLHAMRIAIRVSIAVRAQLIVPNVNLWFFLTGDCRPREERGQAAASLTATLAGARGEQDAPLIREDGSGLTPEIVAADCRIAPTIFLDSLRHSRHVEPCCALGLVDMPR
jgi:hypothetical protein